MTGFPNFPDGKIFPGYKNKLFQKENFHGIRLIRVWTYVAKNKGFIKRTLDHLSYAFSSAIYGINLDCDIIIGTSPTFFTVWSAFFLGKIKRKPWVFELRDIWPESIKSLGLLNDNYIYSFLESIELALYKRSDLVISVTHSFKKNLVKRGIDANKIQVITNGVNLDFFYPIANKDKRLLEKYSLYENTVIGYFGTIGLSHSIDFIVKAMGRLKNENVKLLIAGSGAMKNSIENYINDNNIDNVIVLNTIGKNKLIDYMNLVDIALVPLRKLDTFKEVIPSKIFEAAAMGKPILLGVEGESKKIVEKYQAGVCFEPENELDFIKNVKILKDERLYKKYKNGCLKLASDFSRKKLAFEMYKLINRLIT